MADIRDEDFPPTDFTPDYKGIGALGPLIVIPMVIVIALTHQIVAGALVALAIGIPATYRYYHPPKRP